jgi:hypothetical protein
VIRLSKFTRYLAVVFIALAVRLPAAYAAESGDKVLYSVDFSGQPDGSAIDWLTQNGFVLGLDSEQLNPHFENHQLVLSTDDQYAGIFVLKTYERVDLSNVDRVDIEWSVQKFPKGVNWEKGNNRVAIAVMIFFGTEKLSSGLPFNINAAPYFFSPFVSNSEPPDTMYTGKLYKKGGRYFSVAPPSDSASTFTTRFEIKQRFLKTFNKKEMPAVSGVAIQMNTEDTDGGAVAAIRRISFVEQQKD